MRAGVRADSNEAVVHVTEFVGTFLFGDLANYVQTDMIGYVQGDLFLLIPAGILCGCIAWGVSYLVFGVFRMLKGGM